MKKLYRIIAIFIFVLIFATNLFAQSVINQPTTTTASVPAGGSKKLSKLYFNTVPFDVDSVYTYTSGTDASLVTAKTNSWSSFNPGLIVYYSLCVDESAVVGSQLNISVNFRCIVTGGYITIWEPHVVNVTQQFFLEIDTVATPVFYGTAIWGDYDNDGDLDFLISGQTGGTISSPEATTKIYKNENDTFTEANNSLLPLHYCSAAWGDYDNDGDLDVALIGSDEQRSHRAIIYKNNNGQFTDINANLTGVDRGAVEWADYDGDRDLDLSLIGEDESGVRIAKIYRNNNGQFSDISANLAGTVWGDLAWGDYDKDGDLDVALAGINSAGSYIAKIYKNTNGNFSDSGINLTGMRSCALQWVDYDCDGDLDLIGTGQTGGSISNKIIETKIYRNTNGSFSAISTNLPGFEYASLDCGDFDNDGDPDLLISGDNSNDEVLSTIYRNDNGVFNETWIQLQSAYYSSVSWGDYDNDGDLDILMTGLGDGRNAKLYQNPIENSNTPPTAPQNLAFTIQNTDVILSWDAAEDAETPQHGLSYNIYLGSSSGSNNLISGQADPETGFRLVPGLGNCQKNLSYQIKSANLSQTYYWGVQAIDAGFAGSAFATNTVAVEAPVADFTADTTSGIWPLTVHFTDRSTGIISTRQWNFGDGVTSSQQNPVHTYSSHGAYAVTLIVNGPGGSHTKTRSDFIIVSNPTGVTENINQFPTEFKLYTNYPNPFNAQTTIQYAVPHPSEVVIELYNMKGECVAELFRGMKHAGNYAVIWNADSFSSGAYFIKMTAGDFEQVNKCLFLK